MPDDQRRAAAAAPASPAGRPARGARWRPRRRSTGPGPCSPTATLWSSMSRVPGLDAAASRSLVPSAAGRGGHPAALRAGQRELGARRQAERAGQRAQPLLRRTPGRRRRCRSRRPGRPPPARPRRSPAARRAPAAARRSRSAPSRTSASSSVERHVRHRAGRGDHLAVPDQHREGVGLPGDGAAGGALQVGRAGLQREHPGGLAHRPGSGPAARHPPSWPPGSSTCPAAWPSWRGASTPIASRAARAGISSTTPSTTARRLRTDFMSPSIPDRCGRLARATSWHGGMKGRRSSRRTWQIWTKRGVHHEHFTNIRTGPPRYGSRPSQNYDCGSVGTCAAPRQVPPQSADGDLLADVVDVAARGRAPPARSPRSPRARTNRRPPRCWPAGARRGGGCCCPSSSPTSTWTGRWTTASCRPSAVVDVPEPTGPLLGPGRHRRRRPSCWCRRWPSTGRGTRLGQGGGSYDRALARHGPGTLLVVAVLHPGELLDEPLPRRAARPAGARRRHRRRRRPAVSPASASARRA